MFEEIPPVELIPNRDLPPKSVNINGHNYQLEEKICCLKEFKKLWSLAKGEEKQDEIEYVLQQWAFENTSVDRDNVYSILDFFLSSAARSKTIARYIHQPQNFDSTLLASKLFVNLEIWRRNFETMNEREFVFNFGYNTENQFESLKNNFLKMDDAEFQRMKKNLHEFAIAHSKNLLTLLNRVCRNYAWTFFFLWK